MKSSSERTLPSAVSSRPDTSSRTGAATSTVTRAVGRGMFEPGVIAVMPGQRAGRFCRSLTRGPNGAVGFRPGSAAVAGVVAGGAFVAVLVVPGPAGHDQLGVGGGGHLGEETGGPVAVQGGGVAVVVGDVHAAVRVVGVGEAVRSGHDRRVGRP